MRLNNGVPTEIGDLSPFAGSNRPFGIDVAFGPGCTTDEHLRALAAFIAQLHARLTEVEEALKQYGLQERIESEILAHLRGDAGSQG